MFWIKSRCALDPPILTTSSAIGSNVVITLLQSFWACDLKAFTNYAGTKPAGNFSFWPASIKASCHALTSS